MDAIKVTKHSKHGELVTLFRSRAMASRSSLSSTAPSAPPAGVVQALYDSPDIEEKDFVQAFLEARGYLKGTEGGSDRKIQVFAAFLLIGRPERYKVNADPDELSPLWGLAYAITKLRRHIKTDPAKLDKVIKAYKAVQDLATIVSQVELLIARLSAHTLKAILTYAPPQPAGGFTGLVKGAASKVGLSSDPKLVELNKQLDLVLPSEYTNNSFSATLKAQVNALVPQKTLFANWDSNFKDLQTGGVRNKDSLFGPRTQTIQCHADGYPDDDDDDDRDDGSEW